MFSHRISILFLLCAAALMSCAKGEDIFEDIGDNISSPAGLGVDSTLRRLYLVNSNSKVRYDWQQGSLHVLNIEDPHAPVRMSTASTTSFSGEIHVDTTTNTVYVANRFSESADVAEDHLLAFTVAEAGGALTDAFASPTSTTLDLNPFALAFRDADRQLYIANGSGELQYVNIDESPLNPRTVSVLRTLSNGVRVVNAEFSDIVILGTRAWLSRSGGGVFGINLNELGTSDANPVDYFLDVRTPRGLAVNGDQLLVADEDVVSGQFVSRVRIIDVSTLASLEGDTEEEFTQVQARDGALAGLVVADVTVDRDPQSILVFEGRAYVTCRDDDTVKVIDLSDNSIAATISVGDEPFEMVVDVEPTGQARRTLYVGNVEGNSISIIDITSTDGNTPSFDVVATYTGS